jgi:hypothetical protein
MTLNELETLFVRIGGQQWEPDAAMAAADRMNVLEAAGLGAVVDEVKNSGNAANFFGHLAEVNFAATFLEAGETLDHAVHQLPGPDIDFLWRAAGRDVYMELQRRSPAQPAQRQQADDIGRVQQVIFKKAKKFAAAIPPNAVNLVVIDVCQLIGGMMDVADCLLAAGGAGLAMQRYDGPMFGTPVGAFEVVDSAQLDQDKQQWLADFHVVHVGASHPRDVLHGVFFLFRDPPQTTFLRYGLTGCMVWNQPLAATVPALKVEAALYCIIPFVGWR